MPITPSKKINISNAKIANKSAEKSPQKPIKF